MEEDIKILEKAIKVLTGNDTGIKLDFEKTAQAIKDLIARYNELETIVKTYNAIPNDYMPNDVKIVIADREYFNNGILKENCIPKSKVQEKINEFKEVSKAIRDKAYGENNINYDLERIDFAVNMLQQLLED